MLTIVRREDALNDANLLFINAIIRNFDNQHEQFDWDYFLLVNLSACSFCTLSALTTLFTYYCSSIFLLSTSCLLIACSASCENAYSTFVLSFADVSMHGMLPFSWQNLWSYASDTYRSASMSTLLATMMNGNVSGTVIIPFERNVCFQLARLSNDCLFVRSNTSRQQSAPR